jgi:thioredoxin 1
LKGTALTALFTTRQAEDIAQELGVNAMPTFHIFKDGDVMQSVTGAKGAALEKAIKENYDGKIVEE